MSSVFTGIDDTECDGALASIVEKLLDHDKKISEIDADYDKKLLELDKKISGVDYDKRLSELDKKISGVDGEKLLDYDKRYPELDKKISETKKMLEERLSDIAKRMTNHESNPIDKSVVDALKFKIRKDFAGLHLGQQLRYDSYFLINPNYSESLDVMAQDSIGGLLLRKIYNLSYRGNEVMKGDFDKSFFPIVVSNKKSEYIYKVIQFEEKQHIKGKVIIYEKFTLMMINFRGAVSFSIDRAMSVECKGKEVYLSEIKVGEWVDGWNTLIVARNSGIILCYLNGIQAVRVLKNIIDKDKEFDMKIGGNSPFHLSSLVMISEVVDTEEYLKYFKNHP